VDNLIIDDRISFLVSSFLPIQSLDQNPHSCLWHKTGKVLPVSLQPMVPRYIVEDVWEGHEITLADGILNKKNRCSSYYPAASGDVLTNHRGLHSPRLLHLKARHGHKPISTSKDLLFSTQFAPDTGAAPRQ